MCIYFWTPYTTTAQFVQPYSKSRLFWLLQLYSKAWNQVVWPCMMLDRCRAALHLGLVIAYQWEQYLTLKECGSASLLIAVLTFCISHCSSQNYGHYTYSWESEVSSGENIVGFLANVVSHDLGKSQSLFTCPHICKTRAWTLSSQTTSPYVCMSPFCSQSVTQISFPLILTTPGVNAQGNPACFTCKKTLRR